MVIPGGIQFPSSCWKSAPQYSSLAWYLVVGKAMETAHVLVNSREKHQQHTFILQKTPRAEEDFTNLNWPMFIILLYQRVNPLKSHQNPIKPPLNHHFPLVFPWFSHGSHGFPRLQPVDSSSREADAANGPGMDFSGTRPRDFRPMFIGKP